MTSLNYHKILKIPSPLPLSPPPPPQPPDAGFTPTLAYAVFGSSRQLAIGPVALVSLLTRDGLSRIVDPRTDTSEEALLLYRQLALLLALMVGVLEALMGIVR